MRFPLIVLVTLCLAPWSFLLADDPWKELRQKHAEELASIRQEMLDSGLSRAEIEAEIQAWLVKKSEQSALQEQAAQEEERILHTAQIHTRHQQFKDKWELDLIALGLDSDAVDQLLSVIEGVQPDPLKRMLKQRHNTVKREMKKIEKLENTLKRNLAQDNEVRERVTRYQNHLKTLRWANQAEQDDLNARYDQAFAETCSLRYQKYAERSLGDFERQLIATHIAKLHDQPEVLQRVTIENLIAKEQRKVKQALRKLAESIAESVVTELESQWHQDKKSLDDIQNLDSQIKKHFLGWSQDGEKEWDQKYRARAQKALSKAGLSRNDFALFKKKMAQFFKEAQEGYSWDFNEPYGTYNLNDDHTQE